MAEQNFSMEYTRSIITYDLSNNDISSKEIVDASKNFRSVISVKDRKFELPYTTISSNLNKADSLREFFRVFNELKDKKRSDAEVSRILIVEVYKQLAYIKD